MSRNHEFQKSSQQNFSDWFMGTRSFDITNVWAARLDRAPSCYIRTFNASSMLL